MFPINYDDPYLKANGDIVPIGDIIGGGGGGSEIPEHTSADAGKVLTVNDENMLEWGGSEIPEHTVADAGKVLTVTDENTLAWGEITGGGGFVDVSNSVPLVYNNPTIEGVTT